MLTDSAEKQSNGSSAGNANTPFIAEIISLTNAPRSWPSASWSVCAPSSAFFWAAPGK